MRELLLKGLLIPRYGAEMYVCKDPDFFFFFFNHKVDDSKVEGLQKNLMWH